MNNNPFQSQPKKPVSRPGQANDSILESIRSIGSGVSAGVAKDVVGKTAQDALSAIFGGPVKPAETRRPEMPPRTPEARRAARPAMPEALKPEAIAREQSIIKQEIEKVRMELKALAASISGLSNEVQKAIDQVPVNPGVYHQNFFERLRSVLVLLRQNVQDSGAWLSMFSGRKGKKGYWNMYKKHGTTFGLSHERTASTQSG